MGMPISDAQGSDVPRAAPNLRFFADHARLATADAPEDAPVSREEIFGPVVVVRPFDTEQEAVAAANDTRYGLNAMVFTENLSRAHRVSAALRAGTVWVNCCFVRDLRAPFGGVGESGVGREGGNFSREFFTEPKAVMMTVGDHDHTPR